MTWHYTFTRLPKADQVGVCFGEIEKRKGPTQINAALQRQPCSRDSGILWMIEAINDDTGEARRQYACTNHCCWLRHSLKMPFPIVPLAHRRHAA